MTQELLEYLATYKALYGEYPKRVKIPADSEMEPGKIYVLTSVRALPERPSYMMFVANAAASVEKPIVITLY